MKTRSSKACSPLHLATFDRLHLFMPLDPNSQPSIRQKAQNGIMACGSGFGAIYSDPSLIGRGLEQEFRDRLTALRSESEQESEVLLQQVEHERTKLREELEALRAQETSQQEETFNATQVTGPRTC